jgi:multidrug resistance efflux pump
VKVDFRRVKLAAIAVIAVGLERRLDKMVLRARVDGVVSVIAAEVGENVRAGQPILMVEAARRQWFCNGFYRVKGEGEARLLRLF